MELCAYISTWIKEKNFCNDISHSQIYATNTRARNGFIFTIVIPDIGLKEGKLIYYWIFLEVF